MVVTTGSPHFPGPHGRRARAAPGWPGARAVGAAIVIGITDRDYGDRRACRSPEERLRFGGYDSPTVTAQGACDA